MAREDFDCAPGPQTPLLPTGCNDKVDDELEVELEDELDDDIAGGTIKAEGRGELDAAEVTIGSGNEAECPCPASFDELDDKVSLLPLVGREELDGAEVAVTWAIGSCKPGNLAIALL